MARLGAWSGVGAGGEGSRRSSTEGSGGAEKNAVTMRTGGVVLGKSGQGGAVSAGPLDAMSIQCIMAQWCLP